MAEFIPPPLDQQMREAERKKAYIEAWKRQNKENPPKNIFHAAGRTLLRLILFPHNPCKY